MTKAQVIPLAVTLALGLAALAWQIVSWRRTGPQITAELGVGEVAEDGVLRVEFASGKSNIMALPKPPAFDVPGRPSAKAGKKSGRMRGKKPEPPQRTEFKPVNAIFIHNKGRTAVTVSRCHYHSDFFTFEPQPAASEWGHHLPKRLDPGEDAILVHDYLSMRGLLNKVMRDMGVEGGVFTVVLTLGNGQDVPVKTRMRVRADMDEQELAELEPLILRQEVQPHTTFMRRPIFRRSRSANRD